MTGSNDFQKLSDRIFLSATIGQVCLAFILFFIVIGIFSWQSHENFKEKLRSNFHEWEEELTEQIYVNGITKVFDMNQLQSIQNFRNALRINEIPASVKVVPCPEAGTGNDIYKLSLGKRFLENCLLIQAEANPFAKGVGLGVALLFISLALALLGWRVSRNHYQQKVLNPLIQSLEQEIKDAAVGKMASQIAHDIRSPLLALNVLVRDAYSLQEDKRIILKTAVNRIQDIAYNLLPKKHSLIQQEKRTLCLLPTIVQNLVSEKRVQYRDHEDVQIDFHLEASGYASFVEVISSEFLRTLSNLIDNAIEASPDDDACIDLYVRSRGDEVEVEVRDEGIGIPEDIIDKLTEQGFSYGKKSGSGLGLSYAKEIMEKHGGHIQIKSEVGIGTSVFMMLPKRESPNWFLERLRVQPDSCVVVIDDDDSVHHTWEKRFQSIRTYEQGTDVLHFSHLSELNSWWRKQNKKSRNFLFLVDYEFIGFESNGLDWIVQQELQKQSILVTSRFEEVQVRRECELEAVKLLPKPLAAYIPMLTLVNSRKEKAKKSWVRFSSL